MEKKYVIRIAEDLQVSTEQVRNTITLLEGGATIPFISRYRKEMTGSLDETQIIKVRDLLEKYTELDKRRATILNSIEEQGKLTEALRDQINQAESMSELEDIYLPYRPKKRTRATIAIEKGLEPLAKIIMSQNPYPIENKASEFINEEKGVLTIEDALSGARDIIAEWVNESKFARGRLRRLFFREGIVCSHVLRGKEAEGLNYKSYYEFSEPVSKIPSHRYLAMARGEREGFLGLSIYPDKQKALSQLEDIYIKSKNPASEQVRLAYTDSYSRLLQPGMETEVRAWLKEKSDTYAIQVFADNLRQLMLAPPLGQKNVLAIDPGFRTGCKIVCLDRSGNLLHNETIYPHPPENQVKEAVRKLQHLVEAYKIEAISIGNGTAGRETEQFIRNIPFSRDIIAVMVNESGASVYSASDVARAEFPDYDVTVRGSVSIGRRLMDPLAELVKIDPKAIGVGQYQHDVDQKELQKGLEDTVESCVNHVGVEVNTASKELLSYVSGVGESLAKNVVAYRTKNGPFKSRNEFRKVARFGEKSFEQAAGFLRIHGAENPLDSSAVHPESYEVVYNMANSIGATIEMIIKEEELRKKIDLKDFVTEKVGLPTLTDIIKELAKPGRDPRAKFDLFEFAKGINRMEDLHLGMVLPGIVTNITAFGAFVDIGVHQDGLVHVSEMADKFVRDPSAVVKIHQKVMVRVLDIDMARKRIALSMKGTT